MANKLEYHKTIIDILKARKVQFHIYQPRQKRAYRDLHQTVLQELAREETERMGHKVRNLWVTGYPLSLILLRANKQPITTTTGYIPR